MKTDYPSKQMGKINAVIENKVINLFTNTGIVVSLLLTTIFSSLFIKDIKAETITMVSKPMPIDNLYVTENDKINMVKTNADESLEKGIEKIKIEEEKERKAKEEAKRKEEEERKRIVYDGLTMEQLGAKLDRSLNSTLKGQGYFFAEHSISLGIDPYLALAITMHETGCKWNCSTLVRQCNNVGGMKGSPGCNGGSYKRFNTLSEGIRAYLNNLYNNYYRVGLTTPETIGPKYAASKTWATQVNSYISEIKAK